MKTSHRRTLLQSAGVALALPALEAMASRDARRSADAIPQRAVFICTSLACMDPLSFPKKLATSIKLRPIWLTCKNIDATSPSSRDCHTLIKPGQMATLPK